MSGPGSRPHRRPDGSLTNHEVALQLDEGRRLYRAGERIPAEAGWIRDGWIDAAAQRHAENLADGLHKRRRPATPLAPRPDRRTTLETPR